MILGHARPDVRKLLGAPTATTDTSDTFHPGPTLVVSYVDNVASRLILGAPEAARHERYVRRWLHLPGDGPLVVGGMDLRIDTFVGDNNRIGIILLPAARQSTAGPVLKPPGRVSVESLIRSFPEVPDAVQRRCHPVGGADSYVLACPGFNAAVSYDTTAQGAPKSLTVIDPAGVRVEDDCEAFLNGTAQD